jgi:hypothetical protein
VEGLISEIKGRRGAICPAEGGKTVHNFWNLI